MPAEGPIGTPDTGPAVVAVVLAAGEGTRMKSAIPKMLHGFAGRSLLGHALAAVGAAEPERTVVVVGHGRDAVTAHLAEIAPKAEAVVQAEQRGTGHAVRTALTAVDPAEREIVLVLPGDAPLLTGRTLASLLELHRSSGAAATMLTSEVGDPTGYGRVIRGADGSVERVVEHRDATAQELLVGEVSALVYAFDGALLRDALGRLSTDNSQGEEYLPDVVGILRADGHTVQALRAPASETAGVNDRVQLAAAAREYNDRLLDTHMRAGVTIQDPATTWIDATVALSRDVTLRPNVQLQGSTSLAEGAVVGPDCTLTDTHVGERSVLHRIVAVQSEIGADVTAGPYAYLRPGTVLYDGVHIGTYVEFKNAQVGAGTKVPHLSYVGDATIGEHTNIGAATIFVNYDGVAKHRTEVGSHARTGADNTFVAPVTIGDGAYTGAGTVVTQDVPAGALALSAGNKPRIIDGWVARKRAGTKAAEAAAAAEDEQ